MASDWFSWELEGSRASLLGTGVMLAAGFLLTGRELDFVVSFKQGEESFVSLGEGFADEAGPPVGVWAGLEKKPKMLFCLPPVDDMELVFLDSDGVLGSDFSPILKEGLKETTECNKTRCSYMRE